MEFRFGPTDDELDEFDDHGELHIDDVGEYGLDDEEDDDLPLLGSAPSAPMLAPFKRPVITG